MPAGSVIVHVVFHTHYHVNSANHELCVTGSSPYLGHWCPEKAFLLKQENIAGWWSGQVAMPPGESFEWQLIVRDKINGNVIRYEEREKNRFLNILSGNTMFHVFAYWNYHENFANVYGECAESWAFPDVHQKYTKPGDQWKAIEKEVGDPSNEITYIQPASQDVAKAISEALPQARIHPRGLDKTLTNVEAASYAQIQTSAKASIQSSYEPQVQVTTPTTAHAPNQYEAQDQAPAKVLKQDASRAHYQPIKPAQSEAPTQGPVQAEVQIQITNEAAFNTSSNATCKATTQLPTQAVAHALPLVSPKAHVESAPQDVNFAKSKQKTSLYQSHNPDLLNQVDSHPDTAGRPESRLSSRLTSFAMVTVVGVVGVVLTGLFLRRRF